MGSEIGIKEIMPLLIGFILGALVTFVCTAAFMYRKLEDIANWTFHKLDGRISKISKEWDTRFNEFRIGHYDIDAVGRRVIALETILNEHAVKEYWEQREEGKRKK